MHTPEIVRIISELNEVDKALQYLYEKCKMLKEENDELKARLNNQSPD